MLSEADHHKQEAYRAFCTRTKQRQPHLWKEKVLFLEDEDDPSQSVVLDTSNVLSHAVVVLHQHLKEQVNAALTGLEASFKPCTSKHLTSNALLQGPPHAEVVLLKLAQHLLRLPEFVRYVADIEDFTAQQQVEYTLKRDLPRHWWAYVLEAAEAGLATDSNCVAEGGLQWLCALWVAASSAVTRAMRICICAHMLQVLFCQ